MKGPTGAKQHAVRLAIGSVMRGMRRTERFHGIVESYRAHQNQMGLKNEWEDSGPQIVGDGLRPSDGMNLGTNRHLRLILGRVEETTGRGPF